MTDDTEFLRQIAEAIGGRPVSLGDATTSAVRLPARLARGKVIIFSLGSKKKVGIEINLGSSLYLVIGGPGPAWNLATTPLDDQSPPIYYPMRQARVMDVDGRSLLPAARSVGLPNQEWWSG